MGRLAGLVIGLETAAVVVAYLAFDWPVLVFGVPALLGTGLVLLAVHLSERPRARLAETRASRYVEGPAVGGLMSGFYEVPTQRESKPAADHART
ncbi:hypothetical protein GCM10009836_70950 [Pseudonocardia ailaonensis]|uniref:Major facilitator superfamily (MFS) profile domain-containing protein n=1 Tax=Pseudonocardia ailaonensis TaxID=367279 RepID=A0ABN2NT81_9PSEU